MYQDERIDFMGILLINMGYLDTFATRPCSSYSNGPVWDCSVICDILLLI